MKVGQIDTSKFMVTRKYKKAKMGRICGSALAVMNFVIGVSNAKNHQLPNLMISYGLACFCAKMAHNWHRIATLLKPEYNSIVKRAKQIYKK